MQTPRSLRLLGTPQLEIDGQAVHIERRKAIGVLAWLAVNSTQPHTRETLAALFWPDHERSQAFAYLRNALWTVSKALGTDWIVTEGDTVQFNRDAGITVDVTDFMQLAEAETIPELRQAAELYRGAFLTGFTLDASSEYDDWQYLQGAELRRLAGEALDRLVQLHGLNRAYEDAIPFALRRVALDPLDETAQRRLMRAYHQAGQRGAALRQYDEVVRLLRAELDTDPEPETVRLAEEIRTQASPNTEDMMIDTPVCVDGMPRPATPLIGRADDVRNIMALFRDPACHLVTLIGQGGIGKTRLAIETGRALLEPAAYQIYCLSEAHFIPLASIASPEYLLSTFSTALDFTPKGNRDPKAELFDHLRAQAILLVIDNFEHLLDGAAFLAELLEHAPNVRMIVTSRERLNLQEEFLYEVRGLTHPFHANDTGSFGSVELFYQCARRVGYQPMPADLPHIHEICRMVAGLPLGIELAAGWLQALTPEQIAAEIQRGLDILSTTARNIPERHRSIRAVFETSWARLAPDEQRVLSAISVFYGGFTLEAASVVAGATLSLTHKSLLRRNHNRYEIHELLRQYAEEQLQPDARRAAHDCHADYYAEFLASRLTTLKGREQRRALDEIEAELDNIRTMWMRSIDARRVPPMARAFEAWAFYAMVRVSVREQHTLYLHIQKVLSESGSDAERLLLGQTLALLTGTLANRAPREVWLPTYHRALTILRQFPENVQAANFLLTLVMITAQPGRPMDEPRAILNEALPVIRKGGDRWALAWALALQGEIEHMSIQYAEASRLYWESLRAFQEIGQPWGIGALYEQIADQDHTLGDFEATLKHTELGIAALESIEDRHILPTLRNMTFESMPMRAHDLSVLTEQLQRALQEEDRALAVWTRYTIAGIHLMHERYDEAGALFREVLPEFHQLGFQDGMCWTNIFSAQMALEHGQFAETEQLLQDAEAAIAGMNFPWGASGIAYVRGDLELARGEYGAARALYCDAVRVAFEASSVLQTLRHINGLASLHLIAGDYAQAARIAAFTEQHPATWRDIMKRSGAILAECAKHLPPEQIEAIRADAAMLHYETMMQEMLDQCA
jgi:DNA-binding SARP family transcriptional activator/predicted ATPase